MTRPTHTNTFRAVFLGPPGAGKGTQASLVAERDAVLHVSTGDMLRQHVKSGTALGTRARSFMDSGQLVPDDVIIAMVEQRIGTEDADRSWILDGFPRTVPQAEALKRMLDGVSQSLTHVVFFRVPKAELVARLSSRWTCSACGSIWNTKSKPPRHAGQCDDCGGQLRQRDDDRPEAVTRRLEVYAAQTEPLLDYYRRRGRLVDVDAARDPVAVSEELADVLRTEPRADD